MPQERTKRRPAMHRQQATTQLRDLSPPMVCHRRLCRWTAYLRRMRLPNRIRLPCHRRLSLPN